MSKTVKLKHETASSFSVDGRMYTANKAGHFEMPEDDAAVAMGLGFEAVPEGKKADAKPAESKPAA